MQPLKAIKRVEKSHQESNTIHQPVSLTSLCKATVTQIDKVTITVQITQLRRNVIHLIKPRVFRGKRTTGLTRRKGFLICDECLQIYGKNQKDSGIVIMTS